MERTDYIKYSKQNKELPITEHGNNLETCEGYKNKECFLCNHKKECEHRKSSEANYLVWDKRF